MPGLFWLLPDTKLAGNVAGQFFYAEVALGTLLGAIYGLLRRKRLDRGQWRLLMVAIGAPLVFFGVLRPVMNAARAAGDMAYFGQLHGVASLLFLVACVAVGMLVWRSAGPAAVRRQGE